MNFIWTFESLKKLLAHKDLTVRVWAIERLSRFFPEQTGEVVVTFITDRNDAVAQEAITHFITHPDARHADTILEAYRNSRNLRAGMLANAIAALQDKRLIRVFQDKYGANGQEDPIGCTASIFHLVRLHTQESKRIAENALELLEDYDEDMKDLTETLFTANLIAGTDMKRLFEFCLERYDNPSLFKWLLTAVTTHCGSFYSEEDLTGETKGGFLQQDSDDLVSETLAYLGRKGLKKTAKALEKRFKKGHYEAVIKEIYQEMTRLLDRKKEATGEEVFHKWLTGDGRPRQNISALSILHENASLARKWALEWMARSALVIFSLLLDLESLIGLDIENLDTEQLLAAFLQDRGDVEEDRRIKEILSGAIAWDRVVRVCLGHIENDPDSIANARIVELLADRIDEDIAGRLIGIDTEDHDLWDKITPALSKLGPPAIQLLAPLFEENNPVKTGYALQVLQDLPLAASVDLILDNWDGLWEENKEMLLETVRDMGDGRFIPILKGELKEGEFYEAEVYKHLCFLNNVTDPELKRIAKALERRDKKTRRRMDQWHAGDVKGLTQEPLNLELRCLKCKKAYHYEIKEVLIDSASADPFIADMVRCKNCGTVDHYEVTTEAHLTITTRSMMTLALPEKDKKAVEDSVIKIVTLMQVDGKRMSMKEAVPYYEKKIKAQPENPSYLLGYANILRRAKRTEDAAPIYEKVIVNDPLAVEAYAALAQIAEAKEDLHNAHAYYKRASEIIQRGNYYKVTMDMDDFKEAILDNLVDISRRLGKEPLKPHEVPPESPEKKKIGRNAPCPCGSGKKYKKCCLLKEAQAIPEKPPEDDDVVEKRLIEQLIQDVETLPRKEFLNACALYWGVRPEEPLNLPEEAMEDGGAFMAWVVNDYPLSSGETVIERFYASRQDKLTEEEKGILQSHMRSVPRLCEVQDVRVGVGLTLMDILTGEVLEVSEVRGTYQVVNWDILLVRIFDVKGIKRFAGNARMIPRNVVPDLKKFLLREFETFRKETGVTDLQAFMKTRSYLINRYIRDSREETPTFYTPEGHKVLFGKARFNVIDVEKVLEILEGEKDFVVDEIISNQRAKLSWLKRGESKEWVVVKPDKGVVLDSRLIHESGRLGWDVLGSITVLRNELVLDTQSRERLERGKQRLIALLKGHIRHVVDAFESAEAAMSRARETPPRESKDSYLQDNVVGKSFLTEKYREWLDTRIPALDGQTPREAVNTVTGKGKVLEMIKDAENREERRKHDGEPYVDVGFIRRELGL